MIGCFCFGIIEMLYGLAFMIMALAGMVTAHHNKKCKCKHESKIAPHEPPTT